MNARPFIVFAIVAPALAMAAIDGTIVAVGLPTILVELDTTLPILAWTLTGYALAQTIVMPLGGKLSDDWGRKQVSLTAVALFTVGSIGAGLAPNVYVHIAFRVVQAIGGGAFLPVATGLVSDAFVENRQMAIGLITSFFPLGSAIGPNIGGFIIDHISWRWIFFVNVPIGVLILAAGILLLPATPRSAANHKRLDSVGVGLFSGGMLSLLYGMTHLANHPDDMTAPFPWVMILAGVAMLTIFVRHEGRTTDPLINLELLRNRAFFAANAYGFIFGAVFSGFFSFMPFYAIVAYGLTASESGAILTPRSIATVAMSAFTSVFLIRYGYRLPMIGGAIAFAVSLCLLGLGLSDVTLFGVEVPNVVLLGGMVILTGFGMGLAGPSSQNAALDIMPDKIAALAGLRGMFMSVGGVFGIAGITLALSQFEDKAQGIEAVFTFLGLLALVCLPITLLIPDYARDRRAASRRPVPEAAVAVATEP